MVNPIRVSPSIDHVGVILRPNRGPGISHDTPELGMAYCRVSIISNIQHIGPILDDPNHIWDALNKQPEEFSR